MSGKNPGKSPRGVETRSETRNAEKLKGKQSNQGKLENTNNNAADKSKAKAKAKQRKTEPEKAKSKEKGKSQPTAAVKSRGALKATPKSPKGKHAKGKFGNTLSQEEEVLDYEDEALDNTNASSASESSSESSSSSESESESTPSGESDFSEGQFDQDTSLHGFVNNENNGASPVEEDTLSENVPKNKRKSTGDEQLDAEQRKKKMRKEKTVKMTTSQLEKLMQDTIDNYKQTHENAPEPTGQSKSLGSETTIYSRLCPPVQGGARPQLQGVNQVAEGVELMQLNLSNESNNLSDDSVAAQLNSSDEMNVSLLPVQIPLPPPPPAVTQPRAKGPAVHPREVAQARADDMIKQAELQKAELAKPPGESVLEHENAQSGGQGIQNENLDGSLDYLHNSGTAHVDVSTRGKIKENVYVDLVRLLPRDLDTVDEDENLVLTNQNGKTYHVPPSDRENNQINTFKKWETAFKVFVSVYLEEYPHKMNIAPEFIQYMQLIEDMTTTWIWDNVYKYEKRHRRLMQQFKNRHWHVPYQAARAELKITHIMNNFTQTNPRFKKSGTPQSKPRKEVCRNFNRGKCIYGTSCRYDHRCGVCGKYGHSANQCRSKDTKDPEPVERKPNTAEPPN